LWGCHKPSQPSQVRRHVERAGGSHPIAIVQMQMTRHDPRWDHKTTDHRTNKNATRNTLHEMADGRWQMADFKSQHATRYTLH
jgi:hypothetical protein